MTRPNLSRRGFLGAGVGAGLMAASPLRPAQAVGTGTAIELSHFWRSDSEVAALSVYRNAFERSGGVWFEDPHPNLVALRASIIQRVAEGFQPTIFQWHASATLRSFLNYGVIHPVRAITNDAAAARSLLPTVRDAVTFDGQLAAIPLGIHIENWAWFNRPAYQRAAVDFPNSFADVVDQAPKLWAADVIPLSLGRETWQRCLLHKCIMTDVAGHAIHHRLAQGSALTPSERDGLKESFEIFFALRNEATDLGRGPVSWLDAMNRVADGTAGMQIMGDWVNGEMVRRGHVAEQDYECRPAPGNGNDLMLAIDVIALSRTERPFEREAQATFAEIALDPALNTTYARRKGSLPVHAGADMAGFDSCALQGMQRLLNTKTKPLIYLRQNSEEQLSRTNRVIDRAWSDPAMGATRAADALVAATSHEAQQARPD